MNMSYCRFQNTSIQFEDCADNLRSLDPEDDNPNTDDERRARRRMIETAAAMLSELGITDVNDTIEIEDICDLLDNEEMEVTDGYE